MFHNYDYDYKPKHLANLKALTRPQSAQRMAEPWDHDWVVGTRSLAIELVFVFIVTRHAGSSAKSFMLS